LKKRTLEQYFYFKYQFEGTAHVFILSILNPSYLLIVSKGKLLSLPFTADAAVRGFALLVTMAVLVQSQSLANCHKPDIQALV